MRRVAVAAAALALVACVTPSATGLTPLQEEYLRTHPELGERDRNALLYRVIFVGDTLERVRVAWDGLVFRRVTPETPDVIGGAAPVAKERFDTYEVFVAIGDRDVIVRNGAAEERIPSGRLFLTFRDDRLASYVRME